MGTYEELEHTADWSFRVVGAGMAELLANATSALMELAGVELQDDEGRPRRITLEAPDRESLLVDWLHELVVALEMREAGFGDVQIEMTSDSSLVATLREVPVARMTKAVKAVTYNELEIEERDGALSAAIVLDV